LISDKRDGLQMLPIAVLYLAATREKTQSSKE
jgi:hypothetical protein